MDEPYGRPLHRRAEAGDQPDAQAGASDDKTKIVRAFQLAEKITPDQYKGSVRFVTEKVKDDHPALAIAKHVTSRLSPRCRDRFIECLIVNTLLRGVDKRKKLVDVDRHAARRRRSS